MIAESERAVALEKRTRNLEFCNSGMSCRLSGMHNPNMLAPRLKEKKYERKNIILLYINISNFLCTPIYVSLFMPVLLTGIIFHSLRQVKGQPEK